MAKAILEFDLTDHDDRLEFERANASTRMASALWHITTNTRKGLIREAEAAEENGSSWSSYEAIEKTFEKIWEIINEHELNPDNLIQ
jgi:hypothetical protein